MSPKAKQRVFFGVKLVVTTGLVYWLVHKGALDMSVLGVFMEHKSLLVFDAFVFLSASVGMAAMRWRALLALAGANVGVGRAIHLQFVSLFFNVVIPGNVGGDVIKALYVARDETPEKRTPLLLVAFVERVVGLAGLVSVALVVVVVRGQTLWENPLFRPLVSTILLLGAGFVLGPAVFVVVMRSYGARIEAMASGPSKIAGFLTKVVSSFRLVSARPSALVSALLLSIAVHGLNMALFTTMATIVCKKDVAFGAIATIYPVGLLSLMLPISAAGMGVGHVAFDKLFATVGLTRGADVFNVFFFGQIAPCILGFIPYLLLRGKEPDTKAVEADVDNGVGERVSGIREKGEIAAPALPGDSETKTGDSQPDSPLARPGIDEPPKSPTGDGTAQ